MLLQRLCIKDYTKRLYLTRKTAKLAALDRNRYNATSSFKDLFDIHSFLILKLAEEQDKRETIPLAPFMLKAVLPI